MQGKQWNKTKHTKTKWNKCSKEPQYRPEHTNSEKKHIGNKTKYSRRWSVNYILKVLAVIWKVNGICALYLFFFFSCIYCRRRAICNHFSVIVFTMLRMDHFKYTPVTWQGNKKWNGKNKKINDQGMWLVKKWEMWNERNKNETKSKILRLLKI